MEMMNNFARNALVTEGKQNWYSHVVYCSLNQWQMRLFQDLKQKGLKTNDQKKKIGITEKRDGFMADLALK